MPPSIEVTPALHIPARELKFLFSRSGGPGGQNVNKVATRVELLFDVNRSAALNAEQKSAILIAMKSRVDSDGILHIPVQESRSQWQNRQLAQERFVELLRRALRPSKKRKGSRPTAGSREERFRAKKRRGTIKQHRGRVSPDE